VRRPLLYTWPHPYIRPTEPDTIAQQPPSTTSYLYHDLVLVVGVALAVRLGFSLLVANTYDYDEFVLLLLSRDMAHGAVAYRDFMFFHPPGMLVGLSLLEPLTHLWWPAARVVMIFLDALTTGIVWRLGLAAWDRKTAVLAGLFYAFSPVALISAVRVGQDPVITLLGLTGLCILVTRRDGPSALAAGLCLALAVWVKLPAALFALAYFAAAPRRLLWWGSAALIALAALLAPFWPQHQAMYFDLVTFQRTRWTMALGQRLSTVALYWLLAMPLALPGVFSRRLPAWVVAGFLAGAVFALSPQVYYHYFALTAPFAVLLGARFLARFPRAGPAPLLIVGATVAVAWGALIARGGPSPLYITAAHLSEVRPVVALLDRWTRSGDTILADRFEYAYLANREALVHYFWNVGVLVHAPYLERHLPMARAVVLSHGASSGYPAGFVRFLDARYPRSHIASDTVWWLTRKRK
jgi:hypothetical protein